MQMADQDGGTIARLSRLETKVDSLTTTIDHLAGEVEGLSQAEDRRFADRLMPDRVRALEDQTLELRLYLRQAKWAVALALGAAIAGAVNLMLNLVLVTGT
jgi:hypothetical protein